MANFQFRQLPSLVGLKILKLKNTGRYINNIPTNLETLINLHELDLSHNNLTWIPDQLFKLTSLRRLNLSKNAITLMPIKIDAWENLEVLNLCSNSLRSLPSPTCKLVKLRRLYLDNNQFEYEGIPPSIGKLMSLQVLSLADNLLQTLPDSICGCTNLKSLILNNNRLTTLPGNIYNLANLKNLDIKNNPNFLMPHKKSDTTKIEGNYDYYNINFSLEHHLHLADILHPGTTQEIDDMTKSILKKSLEFKNSADMNTSKKNKIEEGEKERQVLQGMSDVASYDKPQGGLDKVENEFVREAHSTDINCKMNSNNTNINCEIEKVNSNIDYSDFFEPLIGTQPGIICWEIENFLPNRLEEALNGKFYDGDCYIVLKTYYSQNYEINPTLSWKIFYWIGKKASLDKQVCSAMHAVNLRNFLRATSCRTSREEQNEESPEFMEVFDYNIRYIEGGRTATGFCSIVPKEHITRLYRCSCDANSIITEPVPLMTSSLNSENTYLLDTPNSLIVWQGNKCKSVNASKARLLAEKINNVERKKTCIPIQFKEGKEPNSFWDYLTADHQIIDIHTPMKLELVVKKPQHILYKVGLGMGYLELTQVRIPLKDKRLKKSFLDSKGVYILDSYSCDVFIWVGKKANRLVRTAAFKLAKEVIYDFERRPGYSEIIHLFEGTETQMFKCKFLGWNDVLAVDHTRSIQSINKKGMDIKQFLKGIHNEIDLSALFKVRQPALDDERAKALINEWNEDLETLECFVLEGKKYVKLPENEIGQFYSGACYAFICRYWVAVEIKNQAFITIKSIKNNERSASNVESDSEDKDADRIGNVIDLNKPSENHFWEEKFQPVIYFWQGRDASTIGWLTFSFGLGKKFEQTFGKENLQVVRVLQQQESPKFLSHFKRKFIIHCGPRIKNKSITVHEKNLQNHDVINMMAPSLYQIRTNNFTTFYTRCIQIQKCDSTLLNSAFCYILKIPFQNSFNEEPGLCYAWIGSQACANDIEIIEELAYKISPDYNIQVIKEGNEPENFFWPALGGKNNYEKEAKYMNYLRLFRCSNDMGYFRITERCADFCQDDLCDEDIMLLDDGSKVFIWIGPQSSEIEMKLALKSAKLYLEHLNVIQMDKPRKLMFTLKNYESSHFKKCFHAWNHYKKNLN
ncbi:protein flightless-1-like isoform X2 [Gordionus sp. m RMFG-2023]